MKHTIRVTYRTARRILIAVAGFLVLLFGLVIGPMVIMIPLGLSILSLEFAWARRWLDLAKDKLHSCYEKFPFGRLFRRKDRFRERPRLLPGASEP